MEGRRFHGWRAVSDGSKAEEGAVGKALSPQEPRGRGGAEWRPDTEEQREEGALATGPQAHSGGQPWAAPGSPPGSPPVRPVRVARMSPRSQGRRTRVARGA